MEDQGSGGGNYMRALRKDSSTPQDSDLPFRWHQVLNLYKTSVEDQQKETAYPRWRRLYDITRKDGHIKLMLGYDQENPDPNFADPGQRHQVEAILGFERSLENMMAEAESKWKEGDFEGEAVVLEQYADRNPQKDAILDLVAEARRDALSGASTRTRPKRRKQESEKVP